MPSHRRVRASTPCARRASALLPASRSPFRATARPTGLPFQCVTTTPSLRLATVFTGDTHDTTYFRTGAAAGGGTASTPPGS